MPRTRPDITVPDLTGRRAVVTGASDGVGLGIAGGVQAEQAERGVGLALAPERDVAGPRDPRAHRRARLARRLREQLGARHRRHVDVHVDAIDHQGRMHRLTQEQLDYRYRASRLQRGDLIVVSAQLRFTPGDAHAMRREALSILAARRAKFPRVRANCGSVFVSDPALYAQIGPPGLAIERAGLKGVAAGGAQISPDHANFIVNNGGARAEDVLQLIRLARRSVANLSGIAMDAEVRHLAPDGVMRPAHEVAELLGDRGGEGVDGGGADDADLVARLGHGGRAAQADRERQRRGGRLREGHGGLL